MSLGVACDIPAQTEPAELLIAAPRALLAAGRDARPLLVLDGASEVQGPEGFPPLCWLPEDLSENVRVILSARDDSPVLAETRRRGWPELAIEPLSEAERTAFVEKALERVGRRLARDELARIVASEPTRVPLYLRI